ncbi:MAG: hypothetical protein ABJF04_17330 [Reichenbachiella sp.]|uniref:hypothetical protein n=1 Tax=Reichenbachiella sp. TaxID=2184521 RepID=UPI0032678171
MRKVNNAGLHKIREELDMEFLKEQILRCINYNSHIIRAPLSRILSLSNLCANLRGIPEEDQWIVNEINNSASELDMVIRNVGRLLADDYRGNDN